MRHSKSPQSLKFCEMLPILAACYQTGRLVPFIGAGMSRPTLVNWKQFVVNLEQKARLKPVRGGRLDIRAQTASAALRHSNTTAEFWRIVGEALKDAGHSDSAVPAQTTALARVFWPLTVSTNYDHLFYCACRQSFDDLLPPRILGRSPTDCKQVISSLTSPFDSEIIWHIQGFLGEECANCHSVAVQDSAQLARLRSEVVIGHSEYRRVANTAVHFRRCFGEVFRSRSFLFLGSSLSEEYFWNLFGETLELCGPSPVSHFAFLPRQKRMNVRFLAEEMNIVVCEYDDHAQLVPWLTELKTFVDKPTPRASRWKYDLDGGGSLEISPHSTLPIPERQSTDAVAIVVRACSKGTFEFDPALNKQEDLTSRFRNQRFRENEHVLSPSLGLFAVRARTKPEAPTENDAVRKAISELLKKLDHRYRALHLHMPSAGGTVPPVYGFLELVRALGKAKRTGLELVVYVGQQVLLNLTAGQLNLQETLASRRIRFWAVVDSAEGMQPTRRIFYEPAKTPIRKLLFELLGDIDDDALNSWSLSICPSPKRMASNPTGQDWGKTLCDVGIAFGSVLTLQRRLEVTEKEGAATA